MADGDEDISPLHLAMSLVTGGDASVSIAQVSSPSTDTGGGPDGPTAVQGGAAEQSGGPSAVAPVVGGPLAVTAGSSGGPLAADISTPRDGGSVAAVESGARIEVEHSMSASASVRGTSEPLQGALRGVTRRRAPREGNGNENTLEERIVVRRLEPSPVDSPETISRLLSSAGRGRVALRGTRPTSRRRSGMTRRDLEPSNFLV